MFSVAVLTQFPPQGPLKFHLIKWTFIFITSVFINQDVTALKCTTHNDTVVIIMAQLRLWGSLLIFVITCLKQLLDAAMS